MADLYVCGHGNTKPCDECRAYAGIGSGRTGPTPQLSGDGAHLYASLQDGKWYLTAESLPGDECLELIWPWPGQEKSAYELREAGFDVIES